MAAGEMGLAGSYGGGGHMFVEYLLDSSPVRAAVLRPAHWSISLLGSVAGAAATLLCLRWAFPLAEPGVAVRYALLAGVFFAAHSLMVCYTYADAHHLGYGYRRWSVLVLLFSVVAFVLYLLHSAARSGNWKRATLPLAYAFQFALAGLLVLIPLVHTDVLPGYSWIETVPLAPRAGSPHGRGTGRAPRKTSTKPVAPSQIVMPQEIPSSVDMSPDTGGPSEESGIGAGPGTPWGVPDGVPDGTDLAPVVAPPASPPPEKPPTPTRIRQTSTLQAAKLIYGPEPPYPQLAIMTRVQGTVLLRAIISREGTIQDLRVVSGHPLLVRAAVQVVSLWRYRPTVLNGEYVEVETEIQVVFRLSN